MSDGNFNRVLLPSTPYRSGMKMGEQQMRGKAIEAFQNLIKEKFTALSDKELNELVCTFRRMLSPTAE